MSVEDGGEALQGLREELAAMSHEALVEYALQQTARADEQQARADNLEEVVLDQQLAHEETVLSDQVDEDTGLYIGKVLREHYWGLADEYPEREKQEGDRRAPDDEHTLAVFDLDYFTETNARLGHQGANKVLGNFGRIMLKNTRKGYDVQVRLHGDELALLLPRTALKKGIGVVAKILEAFEASGEGTVSAGVTTVDLSKELGENLANADDALYTAKYRGRNQAVDYGPLEEDEIAKARAYAATKARGD